MQAAPQFGRRGLAPATPIPTRAPRLQPSPTPQTARRSDSTAAWIGRMLFSFNGRMRRRDYWLCSLVIGFLTVALQVVAGQAVLGQNEKQALVTLLVLLALFPVAVWTSLAVQVKRWHDRGKSGVWVLINFVPMVGPLWAFIELGFLDSDAGPNRFGPSPKGDPAAVFA